MIYRPTPCWGCLTHDSTNTKSGLCCNGSPSPLFCSLCHGDEFHHAFGSLFFPLYDVTLWILRSSTVAESFTQCLGVSFLLSASFILCSWGFCNSWHSVSVVSLWRRFNGSSLARCSGVLVGSDFSSDC